MEDCKQTAMTMYEKGSNKYRLIYCYWNNVTIDSLKGFHIHHIDHNHFNNHPDNLTKMTPSAHASHHSKGENNPCYGVPLRSRFKSEEDFEQFCINHRRGVNNPQYGNISRITGDRNPMNNMTSEQKEAWRLKLVGRVIDEKSLENMRASARCPKRRQAISTRMKGNQSNQIWDQKILDMSESEVSEYLSSGLSKSRITQVNNLRNPPPPKVVRIPVDSSKEGTKMRLIAKLQKLTEDQFNTQIEGKQPKYVRKLIRLRNTIING